ncbi:hypothetical protein [Sorangium sp. So ce1000]|uniref:hypothetical protein n=1 Tax=Sorangium sp. So ce1000 TaxID=3133325 RepID=UPI003F5F29A5
MRVCRRAHVAAVALLAALAAPGMAQAQEAVPPPRTLAEQPASVLADAQFKARLEALVAELPLAQIGRNWKSVVDEALQRVTDLPQAIAPALPSTDILADPEALVGLDGPTQELPEAGTTFELGRYEVTLAPVVLPVSPVVWSVPGEQGILPGARVRLPWAVP